MPGTTVLTLGNESLSAHAFKHVESLRNAKDRPSRVADDVLKMAVKEDSPGDLITVRWDVDDHTRPTRVRTGYEKYDDFNQPTLKPGTAGWAAVVWPVMISGFDQKKNNGKRKIIDLTKQRTENVYRAFHRQLQKAVLQGPLPSASLTGVPEFEDLLHLNGIDFPTSGGFLEAATSGTGTFHGLSRVTYPQATHPQLHNMYRDVANSASTNLLNALYGISVEIPTKTDLMPKGPSLKWYTSTNVAEFGKRILRPQEQYLGGEDLDDQRRLFQSIGGVPMVPVTEMPQSGLNSATQKASAYLVDWKSSLVPNVVTDWALEMTDFEPLPGTTGPTMVALFKLWIQILGEWPGSCALVTNSEQYT